MTCCYDRPGRRDSHNDPSKTRVQSANTFHQDFYYPIMRQRVILNASVLGRIADKYSDENTLVGRVRCRYG